MSSIGNKEVLSRNLKKYIERSGKDRRELAEIWGFPYSTVSEWINGRKYPRIDRIETMADYFGIMKSDLIEDKGWEEEIKKDPEAAAMEAATLLRDQEYMEIIELYKSLDAGKRNQAKDFLIFLNS